MEEPQGLALSCEDLTRWKKSLRKILSQKRFFLATPQNP
jgi:hypothetical protein